MGVVEQSQVDQLQRRVRADRRDRSDLILREVRRHVSLGGQAEGVSPNVERIGRLVQVEPIRGGDDGEPVASRGMQDDGLGRLLLRELGCSRFARRRLAAGMRDHVKADTVIAKKALQLCQTAGCHRRRDYSPLPERERPAISSRSANGR